MDGARGRRLPAAAPARRRQCWDRGLLLVLCVAVASPRPSAGFCGHAGRAASLLAKQGSDSPALGAARGCTVPLQGLSRRRSAPPRLRMGATLSGAAAATLVGATSAVVGTTGVPPPITLKGVLMLSSCILLGVCGATCMRLSDGFKNVVPSVMIFVTYSVSFVLFTATLPLWQLSIAYAIWSGVGTSLTAVVGVQLFKEKLKPVHYWGFVLIIAGVCAMGA